MLINYKFMEKLVRDKIPEIIISNWEDCEYYIASYKEYINKLVEKLIEESVELSESTNIEELKEEIADVLDVIDAICKINMIDVQELEKIRLEKKEKKWWFEKGIILTKY